jgi:coproporphyrinogen III oxidase
MLQQDTLKQKQQASSWFAKLQLKICKAFEDIEDDYLAIAKKQNLPLFYNSAGRFTAKKWQRIEDGQNSGTDLGTDLGGGEMTTMKGNVFEKVGVNFSEVWGSFSSEFRSQIPGTENSPNFWASGISLVAHMQSPLVPAVHFNTRMIATEKTWFGGGSDLNPIFPNDNETLAFHLPFKEACDKANPAYYQKFKLQCDDYFFIKHRGVARGVGGIFFDYLNTNNFTEDFNFVSNVGEAFILAFLPLVRANFTKNFTPEQREAQLHKRGFYTEFNLLYDRGTKFGLMTNGNVEAILMSLPPIAKWN